jgi:hypothetical protein
MTKQRDYCNQPDRDEPKIKCGYPLPCPWHTYKIEGVMESPVVITPPLMPRSRRVGEAAKALRKK